MYEKKVLQIEIIKVFMGRGNVGNNIKLVDNRNVLTHICQVNKAQNKALMY